MYVQLEFPKWQGEYVTVTVCIWPIRNRKFNSQQKNFQINKKIALQAPCILCNDRPRDNRGLTFVRYPDLYNS